MSDTSHCLGVDVAGFLEPRARIYFDVNSRSRCGGIEDGVSIRFDDPDAAGGVVDFDQLAAVVDAVREVRAAMEQEA